MTAIDAVAGYAAPSWQPHRRVSTLVATGCVLAVGLALVGFLWHGGGMNGARFAAELVRRLAALAFVLAFVAGPLSRLVPMAATRTLGREQAGLMLAFAAIYGVFLICILSPYSLSGTSMPAPTTAFCLFSAFILAVFLACTHEVPGRFLGKEACQGMQSLARGYFWLAFALGALDRLAGPHRPDWFNGFLICLLIGALLIRFADAFVQKRNFRLARKLD